MLKLSLSKLFVLVGFTLLPGLWVGQPLILSPSSASAANVEDGTVGVVGASLPNAAQNCNNDELGGLKARVERARENWAAQLSPESHQAYDAARAELVAYTLRCAGTLNLNIKQSLSGVLEYSAPPLAPSKPGEDKAPPKPTVVAPSGESKSFVPPSAPAPSMPQKAGAAAPNAETPSPQITGSVFDGSPGTGAPPATLGSYPMTAFPADPRADSIPATSVNSPLGGAVQFSSTLTHYLVGVGWSNWSNGYTGDVYYTFGTSLTMFMPPETRAFYFYAEDNAPGSADFTATTDDGTSSYPVSITSPGGAKYFGFYTPLSGAPLSNITVSCPSCTFGFTVGEFGINQNSGADLRLAKFVEPQNTIQAGQTFTYTIFVDNLGPDVASSVIVTDTLLSSGNVSIQSCAFSVSQGGGSITQFTCTTGELVSTQFGTDIGTFATTSLDPVTIGQGRLRASFRLVAKEGVDVTNTTRVTSSTFDPNMDNNFAEAYLSVQDVADLAITKTALGEVQVVGQAGLVFNITTPGTTFPQAPNYTTSPTNVTAGHRIRYTLGVTNNGPSQAVNVIVVDGLPKGVRIYPGSLTISQGSCATGTPGQPLDPMTCGIGTLPSGGTVTISYQVLVGPDVAPGTVLENDVAVRSDIVDPSNDDNFGNTQTLVDTWADMTISKSAVGNNVIGYDAALGRFIYRDLADAVTAGLELRYEVTVQNNGPSDSQNVQIMDVLPDLFTGSQHYAVTFLRAVGASCRPDDEHALWTILWPSASATGQAVVCDLGTMAAGARRTFDIYVQVDPSVVNGTLIDNGALVLFGPSSPPTQPPSLFPGFPTIPPTLPVTNDPYTADNFVVKQATVNVVADLEIKKWSEPVKVHAGDEIKYTVWVGSSGPSDSLPVTVVDTLPAAVEYEIDTGNCAVTGPSGAQIVTCTNGIFKPGQVWQFDIWARVKPATLPGTTITNSAVVSGDVGPGATSSNNTATVENLVLNDNADLAIVKTAPATAGAGETITYELLVTNNGPAAAQNVVVVDYLPVGVTRISFTPSQGTCSAGVPGDRMAPATCNLGMLASSATAEIDIVVKVNSDEPGDTILFNDVQVSSDMADPNNADNIDTVATNVVGSCSVAPGTPVLVSPANNAALAPGSVLLDWTDANCALTYRVEVRRGSQTGTLVGSANPTSSTYNTKALTAALYFWKAAACNGVGCSWTGWWKFSIMNMPGAFNKSSPGKASTAQSINPTLTWGSSSGAASYEYCYDTTNNDSCDGSWTNVGTLKKAPLSGLTRGTTYYWQVKALNPVGATEANGGAWWSFTTVQNLLKNGDFELDVNADGRPDNWSQSAKFTRSNLVVKTGSYAGRFYATDNSNVTINQTINGIKAGKTYSFSGWVNIPPTADAFTFKLQLRWRNSIGGVIRTDVVQTFTAQTAGWQLQTANLVAPAGATSAQLLMAASSLNEEIYVDTFELWY